MKICLMGYGLAGLSILNELSYSFNLKSNDIFVFPVDGPLDNGFKETVQNRSIPLAFDDKNLLYCLSEFKPDLIISAYYPKKIDKSILDLSKFGGINLHPSLLPKYRGCFSGLWNIINDEESTGNTFHFMNEKIDQGNIIFQRTVPIERNETGYSLYYKQIYWFAKDIVSVIEKVANGYKGEIQKIIKKEYYKRELPNNGVVDIDSLGYEFCCRFVRALFFPPFNPAQIVFKKKIYIVNTIEELDTILESNK